MKQKAILLIFLAFITLVSCTKGKEGVKVTLADAISPYSAPVYVADKKGFFKEEGLDMKISSFTAGRLCLEALLGGKADFGLVADTPIMRVGFTNPTNLAILSTMARSDAAIKLIARKDMGINSPADLKGKKIGNLIGTSSEFFLTAFLKKNGVAETDVTRVNLGPPNMPGALINGDVDAFDIWEPHVQNALNTLKDKAIVMSDTSVYTLTWNVLTTRDVLKNNFASAKKVLRALIRAEDFIRANRDESIRITAEAIGMQIKELSKIWDDYIFDNSLSPVLLDTITRQEKWAREKDDSLKGSPDYLGLIDRRALKELKPQSVTIE